MRLLFVFCPLVSLFLALSTSQSQDIEPLCNLLPSSKDTKAVQQLFHADIYSKANVSPFLVEHFLMLGLKEDMAIVFIIEW
jgi:hypothetical protein